MPFAAITCGIRGAFCKSYVGRRFGPLRRQLRRHSSQEPRRFRRADRAPNCLSQFYGLPRLPWLVAKAIQQSETCSPREWGRDAIADLTMAVPARFTEPEPIRVAMQA